MIVGTDEQWDAHLSEVCTCNHIRREHVNARGPYEHYDGCNRFDKEAGQ